MTNYEEICNDYLNTLARRLPKQLKQLVLSTTELYKLHFSIGLEIRNAMFADKTLMDSFIKTYGESDPDTLSNLALESLKLRLQALFRTPLNKK